VNRTARRLAWSAVLLNTALAGGAASGVAIGQPFTPSQVNASPLCHLATCHLEGPFVSEDKFSGANKTVLYRYTLTWRTEVVNHPVVSVILNDRQRVRLVKLEFSVPQTTAPAAFRDLVLAWGKTFGLGPTNLAPCLKIGGLKPSPKYLPYASLPTSIDGACRAVVLDSGQASMYFDVGLPEP
jgi:hypothetical protein